MIEPEVKNVLRRHEIVERLQVHVSPDNFTPRALYDGKANLFASHDLKLAGGSGRVSFPLSSNHFLTNVVYSVGC